MLREEERLGLASAALSLSLVGLAGRGAQAAKAWENGSRQERFLCLPEEEAGCGQEVSGAWGLSCCLFDVLGQGEDKESIELLAWLQKEA